jgi:dihydroxyacetone kinase
MSIQTTDVKRIVLEMSKIIIASEQYFCELDSVAGDGDFGMSLAKGFREILKQIDDLDDSAPHKFLRGCSMTISEFCGGASGPLWGAAFNAAAASAKGKETLELTDVAEMFKEAASGIQKRGGAQIGDKTLLDALIPAAEALQKAADAGKSIQSAFADAAAAALRGAEATKEIAASKGRATYVGERSVGYPDAGAAAVGFLFGKLTGGSEL